MANNDVFRELDNLRREIDEVFRGFGFTGPFATRYLSPAAGRRFPLVNLSEDEGHVYVEAIVTGMDPREIDLSVLRNTLTITGERKSPMDKQGQIVHRSEIGAGKFTRTVELPVEIDPNRITAECKAGIINVSLAKAEHAKPKKVDIKLA